MSAKGVREGDCQPVTAARGMKHLLQENHIGPAEAIDPLEVGKHAVDIHVPSDIQGGNGQGRIPIVASRRRRRPCDQLLAGAIAGIRQLRAQCAAKADQPEKAACKESPHIHSPSRSGPQHRG